MATSNSNVLQGFEAYLVADARDGRAALTSAHTVVLERPAGPLKVYLDVVLDDDGSIAGRAVMWDGPDFSETQAPLIAAPFSAALRQIRPEATITTVGVWQGRRQRYVEVPFEEAQAALPAADRIHQSL